MSFAETLAALRRSRDLTQVALAERAGVNVSQLRKYEAGGPEPSLSALRRLAVALSCTTDALVFGEDPRLPDDQALRLAFEATIFLDNAERATVREVLDAFIARHNPTRRRPAAPAQTPQARHLSGTVANVAASHGDHDGVGAMRVQYEPGRRGRIARAPWVRPSSGGPRAFRRAGH